MYDTNWSTWLRESHFLLNRIYSQMWNVYRNAQVYCYFKYMYMNFLGEEDQTCYDISRLRKPDSTFDRGYYYSSLSTKYEKGSLK